jgi:hypothetical protein
MNDETPAHLQTCAHGLLVQDEDCPDCAEAQQTQPRVRVTLRDLAKASTPIAQALKSVPVPFADRPPKTPAGLPQGCSWLPHDTGKRGLAAARRRAQMARRAAKLAKQQAHACAEQDAE